jgi:hypothetical protein
MNDNHKPDCDCSSHPVIDALVQPMTKAILGLWRAGVRMPELSRAIRATFPASNLNTYNAAANIAWESLSEIERTGVHRQ